MVTARNRIRPLLRMCAAASLVVLALVGIVRPRGAAAAPKDDDLSSTTATVTDNQDPEKAGRVKVRFHWDRGGNPNDGWARLVVPLGGPTTGASFIPEVNDEVMVAFEHGDIHRPYVIGALWNGRDKP